MKKILPLIIALLAVAAVAMTLRGPKNKGEYDIVGFSRLPTLVNGRVKPLDTVARTSLLILQGRQGVKTFDGRRLTPSEWLLDVLYRRDLADTYPVFEIVHPEVLSLFDLVSEKGAGGKRFSIAQLAPKFGELDRQARLASETPSAGQTAFQRGVLKLWNSVILYQRLQLSLASGDAHYFERLAKLPAAIAGSQPGMAQHGSESSKLILELSREFTVMDSDGYLRPIPPESDMSNVAAWSTEGGSLNEAIRTGKFNPAALAFADIGRGWQDRNSELFNRAVREYTARVDAGMPELQNKSSVEHGFNSAEPFFTSQLIYVAAFLAAVISWLIWQKPLGNSAYVLVIVAFVLSTIGIATRMWLEGRPPVTNLYSSAVFVGWGAVLICIVLEHFFRNAIPSAVAGLAGFASLMIASQLALQGDTLEMMRAVLDSNFWLATHVVTIAVGYSATFIAGFLGLAYVFIGLFTKGLDKATADAVQRMIYGTVCFATFFSLVGTVLGGIWADQSWGRFWGWDPKENGALILVLWTSIFLHARWGGLVKQRGLAALAIGGNIVTGWSWFGVNLLGVGLHSYGFMDKGLWALVGWWLANLVFIGLCGVPLEKWRSYPMMTGAGKPGARANSPRGAESVAR